MKVMYQNFYAAFVMLAGLTCSADELQVTKLQLITPLPEELDECSGMASLGDQ